MKLGVSDIQRMGKQHANEKRWVLFVCFPGLVDSVVRTGEEGRQPRARKLLSVKDLTSPAAAHVS